MLMKARTYILIDSGKGCRTLWFLNCILAAGAHPSRRHRLVVIILSIISKYWVAEAIGFELWRR
jgi:hypothetical protein